MGPTSEKGSLAHGRFELAYRVSGEPNLPTVVMVNGAQQTMASWRGLAERLGDQLRFVMFDIPGVGRSRILSGREHVEFDEQTGVVWRIIDELCQAPVAMFGASWGCLIAAGAAAGRPELVERLVLASFGLRPNPRLVELIDEGLAGLRAGDPEAVGRMMVDGFGGGLPEEFGRQIVAQFSRMDAAAVAAFDRHASVVRQARHASDFVDLSAIGAETLIINGEDDTIIDGGDAHEAVALIPRAEAIVVPGAGHFLHQEVGFDHLCDVYASFLTGGRQGAGAADEVPHAVA